jgi:hypothetical protein
MVWWWEHVVTDVARRLRGVPLVVPGVAWRGEEDVGIRSGSVGRWTIKA